MVPPLTLSASSSSSSSSSSWGGGVMADYNASNDGGGGGGDRYSMNHSSHNKNYSSDAWSVAASLPSQAPPHSAWLASVISPKLKKLDRLLKKLAGTARYNRADRKPHHANNNNNTNSNTNNNHEAHTNVKHSHYASSPTTAFITFLKGLFGVGLLAHPRILGEVGLLLGILIYVLISISCMFSCWLLLESRALAVISIASSHDDHPKQIMTNHHHKHHHNTNHDASQTTTRPPTPHDDGNNDYHQFSNAQLHALHHSHNDHNRTDNELLHADDNDPHQWNNHQVKAEKSLVTYGDLAGVLLGRSSGGVVIFVVVILHVLFASGMIFVAVTNLAQVLGWGVIYSNNDENENDDNNNNSNGDMYSGITIDMMARQALGSLLFPVIVVLVRIPRLQDLFVISATGLSVYMVGCVGSLLYTAILSEGHEIPQDVWEVKWDGIPVFVASTVYAIEGINLALPTVNSLQDTSKAVPVVCASVLSYGVLTLGIAVVGYLGGMGGGPGTHHSDAPCRDVSNCIQSTFLKDIHKLSLALALICTLPVILYPSTEMLECYLKERSAQQQKRRLEQQQQQQQQQVLASSAYRSPSTPLAMVQPPPPASSSSQPDPRGVIHESHTLGKHDNTTSSNNSSSNSSSGSSFRSNMWVKPNTNSIMSQPQHTTMGMTMVNPQGLMPPSHSNRVGLPPPRHPSLVDFMVEDDTLANSSTESVTGSLPTDSSGDYSNPVPSHDPSQEHHVHMDHPQPPPRPPPLQIQLPTPQKTGFFKGIAQHCHTLQLLPTASSPHTFNGTFSPRQSDSHSVHLNGSMSMQNQNNTIGPPPPQRLGTIIQQHHRKQHHSFRAMDSEDSAVVLLPGEKPRISAVSGIQNQNQFVVMPHDKYVPNNMVIHNQEEEGNSNSTDHDGRSLWLRIALAVTISVIGATCGMYSSVVTFVRGIGLSFVGFILPPILYLCAREGAGRGVEHTSSIMMALSSLIGFGLFNMALVCVSVFTEHKFMPSQS